MKTYRYYIYMCVGFVLLCSLAGLGAYFYRFFDYFNHFRPQLAAGAAFVLLLAWVCRMRGTAYVAVLIVVLNLGLMGWGALRAMPPVDLKADGPHVPISIISANVLVENHDPRAWLTQIMQHDPDIIVVLELNKSFEQALTALDERYPHHLVVPRKDSFGIALYAKWPFTGQVVENGWYKLPLIRADFDAFTLLAAHPISPMSFTNRMEQSTYMQAIGSIAQGSDKPVILAGDLNATLWSVSIQPLLDAGFYHIGAPFHYTWPSMAPPLAIQIDHVFATHGVTGDLSVLDDIGSDHFPIRAVLSVPGKS